MVTKDQVLMTADMMAAAASNLNMGTYDTLINCREDLKNQLHEIFNLIGTRPDSIRGGLVD